MTDHTFPPLDELREALHDLAPESPNPVKLMFLPPMPDAANWGQFLRSYAQLVGLHYEAVFVVEESPVELEKKISMASASEFEYAYGSISAHDGLRNEFADEDDDLYVDDGGVHEAMSLQVQLPFLRAALDDFSVVSVQINRYERTGIIKELAYVIEEILGERNALVVFCCDLPAGSDYQRLQGYISEGDLSNMFNSLNAGTISMAGHSAFLTGMLVCREWGLELVFDGEETMPGESMTAGRAYLKGRTDTR